MLVKSNTTLHAAAPFSRAVRVHNTHRDSSYLCSQVSLILRNRTHWTDDPCEEINLGCRSKTFQHFSVLENWHQPAIVTNVVLVSVLDQLWAAFSSILWCAITWLGLKAVGSWHPPQRNSVRTVPSSRNKSIYGPEPALLSPHGRDVMIQKRMLVMLEKSSSNEYIYTSLIYFKWYQMLFSFFCVPLC